MTATQAHGPGRRAGLDRDDVVGAALALVEADGPDALTMRGLAADLGVATTTIYWHVGDRDTLVRAVVERASRRPVGAVAATDPRERIVALAAALWQGAHEHRHVAALAHQAGLTGVLGHPVEVALAHELETAGLRGDAVRDALRAVVMCVAGFLVVGLRRVEPDASLWADAQGVLAPDTLAALERPPDLPVLLARAVGAIVDDALAAVATS